LQVLLNVADAVIKAHWWTCCGTSSAPLPGAAGRGRRLTPP